MECRYCQASNSEDEHRCRRCGRRLRMTPVYVATAAAPALRPESQPVAALRPAIADPAPARTLKPITYQPSLFTSRELPRVVPFETIAPGSIEAPPRKVSPSLPRQRPRKVVAGQQSLEFSPNVRSPRAPEGAIYCDAPVAIPTHRALAAALDGSIILISLALFTITFRLFGGQVILNAKTAPLFLAVVGALVVCYRLLWCFAEEDSPGMRWSHLMLINFDGQAPNRQQRISRAASGFLSLAAGGLGLLWAIADEETLTWHDHISKTFPTPR
ncbi:MAG: RDD family protein [Acidobacteriia bacterium]|nr:RDD family protein [Terriglobia bacterium]